MQDAVRGLSPRVGSVLRVLGIARISTEHQDARSLEDQEALYRSFLNQQIKNRFRLEMISGRGSGEHLDRAEYLEAWARVETHNYDLVITEDLGRIARRAHAVQFIEHCEDHETRLIAINDQIDTAQENWRVMAGFASLRHELYNADTGKRIRRSLRNRFEQGGVVQSVIFGYTKLPGAKSDQELQKDPTAAPIYDKMFTMLEEGASFSEVADWLNKEGIPPGPYSRRDRWDRRMVRRIAFNPILKGLRFRNRVITKRVNSTGRRKAVKAPPSELLERTCPHLAFIDGERYDQVIAKLKQRCERNRRSSKTGQDPRQNVSRKRTVFPGQHATCGVCGRLFYWGGHGQATRMTCSGSRDYVCWNTASFDGLMAGNRIAEAILQQLSQLPEFDTELRKRVEAQANAYFDQSQSLEESLRSDLSGVERKIDRVVDLMIDSPSSQGLGVRLADLESRKREIQVRLADLKLQRKEIPVLPLMAEIREQVHLAISTLAKKSPEFGRLMRIILPQIQIYSFQSLDTGRIVSRAFITLNLTHQLSSAFREVISNQLQRQIWVDLFEQPQHIRLRQQILEFKNQGLKERDIASRLNIEHSIVQRAMSLHRRLIKEGRDDPYQILTIAPLDNPKCSMHKHPRYQFEPLAGYPLWPAT